MCLLKTWFLEIRSFFLNHKIWFFSIWLLLIVHWSHQRTLTFISCNFHIKNMSHVPYLDCPHCIVFCRNMSPTMQLWIKLWTLFELYENVLLKSCVVQKFQSRNLSSHHSALNEMFKLLLIFSSLKKPWFSKFGFSYHWKVFCSWMKVKQKHSTSCLPREDMFPECRHESSQECWTRHRARVTCSRVLSDEWWSQPILLKIFQTFPTSLPSSFLEFHITFKPIYNQTSSY